MNDFKNRPIPREVAVNDLSPEEIKHTTQTVFAASESQAVELLFIYGTSSINNPSCQFIYIAPLRGAVA